MRAILVLVMAVTMTGAARGEMTASKLADGTVWVTVDQLVRFEVFKTMPTGGEFSTFIISNRDTDIVNGPQSDKVQIKGDCATRTYEIMGGVAFSGKLGSGYPMDSIDYEDLDNIGRAGIVRRVMPDSNVEIVFAVVCRQ